MKRLLAVSLAAMIVFSFANSILVYADDSIKVSYNGNQLALDVNPYIKDGRTMVPFRKVLEAFGAQVSWNDKQQVLTAVNDGTEVDLKIGVDYAYVNSYQTPLDVPPEIVDGRTFVPLRFVSENLGAVVKWDGNSKTISINYNNAKYKVGQQGTFEDLKFSVDSVDSGTSYGTLKVAGKINSERNDLDIEVSDDLGFVVPGTVKLTKSTDGYTFNSEFSLPTCHKFEAKRIVLKVKNDEQKLIKIGEFDLGAVQL